MGSGKLIFSQRAAGALAVLGVMALVAQAKGRRPAVAPSLEPSRIALPQAATVPPTVALAAAGKSDQPTGPASRAVPSSPPRAINETLTIASADRISIKIQGQTELSGEYRINDDQTISVPVIGRVPVTGLDAAGLERTLSERLARLVGREAYVTVEVIEYRPVFISGYVSKPGTAPWKPGMTILQAVTVSGGTFRGSDSNGVDGASTKRQRTIDDQKRVLATIARLTAEQNGAEKMELPPRLIALVGRKEAQELIDAQLTSFLSRRNATESHVSGLQRASALAKQELESLRAQRGRLGEQLKFRREQFTQLKVLYNKQFLRLDRLTEEELRIADLEEKVASLGVSISRTDSTLVGLERDLGNIRQDRRAIIDTDLLKLERDAAQLELEIEAAGPLARKVNRPGADADGAKQEVLLYEIVRQDGAAPKTLKADRNTLLRPGDMVVVSLQ